MSDTRISENEKKKNIIRRFYPPTDPKERKFRAHKCGFKTCDVGATRAVVWIDDSKLDLYVCAAHAVECIESKVMALDDTKLISQI